MNFILKIMKGAMVLLAVWGLSACSGGMGRGSRIAEVAGAIDEGRFSEAVAMTETWRAEVAGDSLLVAALDSLADLTHRLRLEFSLSEEQIRERLAGSVGVFTEAEFLSWEDGGWLEWRMIDGEKRYFNRAASNLKRLLDHRRGRDLPVEAAVPEPFDTFRMHYAAKIIELPDLYGQPVCPVTLRVKYTLTVEADAVPPGEVIRCWLPWPRENHLRQQEIRLLEAFPAGFFVAPDTVGQRSLYMEQKAEVGQPVRFETSFSWRSAGHYFDPAVLTLTPWCDPAEMREYLAEQPPHIRFTPRIRELSDSIVGHAATPLETVRRIFYWIDSQIPWAGALEYGVMPNIPEYVLTRRHGDCGMKTLLFMTLARYNGVPVKWQSGWMMHPGEVNLHDWCEVWYEGAGWVPLDMSFGRLPSADPRIRDFYMTGIDPWRLIVNDAVGETFVPAKKYPRSEPVDFQRGEVEWRGGNLYFNRWSYRMSVEYL